MADCPQPENYTDELLSIIREARDAPNETAGRIASDKMWQVWLRAPDEAAQTVLDRGMRKRSHHDFAGAYDEFDRLVRYCPEYAEGYNQRAFVNFLRQDFEAALADLDVVLALAPYHVGAQSGRALTLMNLGRIDEARQQLQDAVRNNPWLGERALLAKGAPLGPVGEDI